MSEGWIDPEAARKALRDGGGAGVRIAVIDSGVDGVDLRDSVSVKMRAGRAEIIEGDGADVFGHGTAVAGIIRELAPEAEIGSFRVLGKFNQSRGEVIAAGVREALRRGYQILNCSFGAPGTAKHVLEYKAWLDEAYLAGAHVVAACSNENPELAEWPSHFTSPVSVGIADLPAERYEYRPGSLVEFFARGENIEVDWLRGTRKTVLGSSFAAPHMSAFIARLLSRHPDLSPPLLNAVLRTAGLVHEGP